VICAARLRVGGSVWKRAANGEDRLGTVLRIDAVVRLCLLCLFPAKFQQYVLCRRKPLFCNQFVKSFGAISVQRQPAAALLEKAAKSADGIETPKISAAHRRRLPSGRRQRERKFDPSPKSAAYRRHGCRSPASRCDSITLEVGPKQSPPAKAKTSPRVRLAPIVTVQPMLAASPKRTFFMGCAGMAGPRVAGNGQTARLFSDFAKVQEQPLIRRRVWCESRLRCNQAGGQKHSLLVCEEILRDNLLAAKAAA
jgi:hypothetical protein